MPKRIKISRKNTTSDVTFYIAGTLKKVYAGSISPATPLIDVWLWIFGGIFALFVLFLVFMVLRGLWLYIYRMIE
jgi:hypothetical protein